MADTHKKELDGETYPRQMVRRDKRRKSEEKLRTLRYNDLEDDDFDDFEEEPFEKFSNRK
jgi:hypothetical protein